MTAWTLTATGRATTIRIGTATTATPLGGPGDTDGLLPLYKGGGGCAATPGGAAGLGLLALLVPLLRRRR